MKIGINLVGVSYNDGTIGRYRNYEDAIGGFFTNVVTPYVTKGMTYISICIVTIVKKRMIF